MAVEQSVDEVQIAGPAAAGTNGELAGQVRFGAGREGRDLFVPDVDPLDLTLSSQSVGQAIEAVADDAIDSFDAGSGQCFYELVGYCFCHFFSLLDRSTR
jgi:hypothetical protein